MPKDKDKEKEPQEPGIWHFREIPREVIVKAKIGAALEGLSVKAYVVKLVEAHWQELEKKGVLPKGKRPVRTDRSVRGLQGRESCRRGK